MEKEYPKRLIRDGCETQVHQINNSCRKSILTKIEKALPAEYAKVKADPVFAHVFALFENGLHFSARLIHSILCRQLVTNKKHELWFVFGGKPLRFSLQEFYAVTGLKYKDDFSCDLGKWKDDKGFWSKLLKRKDKITLKKLREVYLIEARTWQREEDRIRLVYICVIVGLVMAIDEKKIIPLSYIQLVMDLEQVRAYPWGRIAFEHLLQSIIKTRDALKNTISYMLDGFSYALQIWVMESIPVIGELLGKKINSELTNAPRCSNWEGVAKVSYEDIIRIETTLGPTDVVYPYISYTGNFDVFESVDFLMPDEIEDDEVSNLNALIRSGHDFKDHIWGWVEVADVECDNIEDMQDVVDVAGATVVSDEDTEVTGLDGDKNESDHGVKSRKTKHVDHGAESRKKRLLCDRASTSHVTSSEEMKSFIKDTLDACFKSFGDNIDKRFVKLEDDVALIKDFISTFRGTSFTKPTTLQPPNTSDSQRKLDEKIISDDLFTNSCELDLNMSTQDFLHTSTGHLSQKTQVIGFDPPHDLSREVVDRFTPFSRAPYVRNPGQNEKDAILVYVSEDRWNAIEAWSRNPRSLNFGPVVIDHALLTRIIGRGQWLRNQDMDATMYLFRENASLGRLKSERVDFMNCMFSMQISEAYKKFLVDKKTYKWDSMILAYANGEMPAHGKTRKKWASDVDKIYTPLFVHNNHWIALCINFVLRQIEVFDCYGNNNKRLVEPFAITIPRIVKEIQPKSYGKNLHLSPYSIIHVSVPQGLNKSHSDCGVYALKYIESHLLQLGTDLLNDDNIMEARLRIAVDLWEAASDPVFIDRMAKFEPPALLSHYVDIV